MSPLRIATHGLLSGFAASLLLSLLSHALPGLEQRRRAASGEGDASKKEDRQFPANPFDPRQVRKWQARAQSPAAKHSEPASPDDSEQPSSYLLATSTALTAPADALTLPQAPGPEGLAEQFAYKLAAGLFGLDISRWLGPAGMATHLVYGSLWGALYGVVQASVRRPPARVGAAFGLFVWVAGPATLVPAMKLMPPPWRESPPRAALLAAGHLAYGLALASAFDALQREAS